MSSAWLLVCRICRGRSIPAPYRPLLNLDRQAMRGGMRGCCAGGSLRGSSSRMTGFHSLAMLQVPSTAPHAGRAFDEGSYPVSESDWDDWQSEEDDDYTGLKHPDIKNKGASKAMNSHRSEMVDSSSEKLKMAGKGSSVGSKTLRNGKEDLRWEDERGDGMQKIKKQLHSSQSSKGTVMGKGIRQNKDSAASCRAGSDTMQEVEKLLHKNTPSSKLNFATAKAVERNENAAAKGGANIAMKGSTRKGMLDSDSGEEFCREGGLQPNVKMLRTKGKWAANSYESDEASSDSDNEFAYSQEKSSISMKRKVITENNRSDSAVKRRKVGTVNDKTSTDTDYTTSHLSESRFDQFNISSSSIRSLHSIFKYERMTPVQEATFPVILEGKDVLAKARTGTGKTIAFLLPAIEVILKAHSDQQSSINAIYALVVCPTRELAQQACKEAITLLQYHKGIGAQVVIGGNKIGTEQRSLKFDPCQILVGTPGRLVDHISRTPRFSSQLKSVKLFVLDEADHMLDMGFRKSLDEIMRALPSRRQTLLFSATIPDEVHKISKVALRQDHEFIDTVGKDNTETHAKVKQNCIVAPTKSHLALLYHVLEDHMKREPDYKVLIFCTTARVTALLSELFRALGFNSREIHSRKTQEYRTRVSNEFRMSKGSIILFTSDVSARGVDYPNVTLVLQVGIPSEREQYIHRLGRTGRAGKDGEGVLLLAPWEDSFLSKLKDIPIQQVTAPGLNRNIQNMILSKASTIDTKLRSGAYTAWLGYYKSVKGLSLSQEELFHYANEFSSSIGFDMPPTVSRNLLAKMGLANSQGTKGNSHRRR